MSELNPCPKCGSDCRIDVIPGYEGHLAEYFAVCNQCVHVSKHAAFRAKAIRLHNSQGQAQQQEEADVEPCPRCDQKEARIQADEALKQIEQEEAGWYRFDGEGQRVRREDSHASTR